MFYIYFCLLFSINDITGGFRKFLFTIEVRSRNMARNISSKTAQQIVDTVKDVCGYDINFILPDGTILASTNPDRVGTYHEIGHQAAGMGTLLEVTTDDAFYGTQKGVNLPFTYQGEIVAVIGITGEPEEVRRYAYLAQRITRIILRERDLDSLAYTQREQTAYVVRSLTEGTSISHSFFEDFQEEHKIDPKARYRTVLVRLESRYNPANLSMIEGKILRVFDQTESPLHAFEYPDRYILIETEEAFRRWSFQLKKLSLDFHEVLRIGVGSSHQLVHQNRSYREALIAAGSLSPSESYAEYDSLKLEILLGSVSEDARKRFRSKTVVSLDDREREILRAYFDSECHLKKTAEQLFLHVNTLQYQLDKIARKTGLNPRKFEDAVILYLGLKV